jgi:hypothetical protein
MSITHVEVRRHPVWRDEVAAPVRGDSSHAATSRRAGLVMAVALIAVIAAGIALALR